MIDRGHALPLVDQARQLGISRDSIYYLAHAMPDADLTVMSRIDESHLLCPFAGSRMLRDQLLQEGIKVGQLHAATLRKRKGLEVLYRRPNTSKSAPGTRSTRTCLARVAGATTCSMSTSGAR